MARPKSILNEQKSEVINDNFLKQNPEGLPEEAPVIIAKEIPRMREIVFINERDPGYSLEFHYHSATHPLHRYTLFHGQTYTLPEEIIEHLESKHECLYGYRKNAEGMPEMYVRGQKYLFRCKSANKRAA